MVRRKAPTVMDSDTTRADALLRLARPVRDMALPEPVKVPALVNGRRLEPRACTSCGCMVGGGPNWSCLPG